MERKDVFVTGATGFIGQHLVNRLIDGSQRLQILTRDSSKVPPEWKDRLTVVKGDLSDHDLRIPPGITMIFHCASEIRDEKRFRETNVEGTRKIVDYCLTNKECRLVFLSSAGVMGSCRPGPVDESLECAPKSLYAKTKFEAEKIIKNAVKNSGLNAVILRPSIVYGPGIPRQRDSFLALIRSINDRKFFLFGSRLSYYNIVYSADVVSAMIFLAETETVAPGEIFIINEPVSWPDFVKIVLLELKKDYPVLKIPLGAGYVLAFLSEISRLVGLKMPLSLSRFRALTSRTVFKADKLLIRSGFRFEHGNARGIADTVDHYRKQGLLE